MEFFWGKTGARNRVGEEKTVNDTCVLLGGEKHVRYAGVGASKVVGFVCVLHGK